MVQVTAARPNAFVHFTYYLFFGAANFFSKSESEWMAWPLVCGELLCIVMAERDLFWANQTVCFGTALICWNCGMGHCGTPSSHTVFAPRTLEHLASPPAEPCARCSRWHRLEYLELSIVRHALAAVHAVCSCAVRVLRAAAHKQPHGRARLGGWHSQPRRVGQCVGAAGSICYN